MKILNIFILLLFSCWFQVGFAQPLTWMRYPKPYKWMLSAHWNAVEDDGRGLYRMLHVKEAWNIPVFPAEICFDKFLKRNYSLEFCASYNQYKKGKLINDSTNYEGIFIGLESNFRYSFFRAMGSKKIDPYISTGIGLTYRPAFEESNSFSANLNFGTNFFVYKSFGIKLETSAKFSFYPDIYGPSNYLQHSVGIIYKAGTANKYSSSNKRRNKWIKKKNKSYKGKRNNK